MIIDEEAVQISKKQNMSGTAVTLNSLESGVAASVILPPLAGSVRLHRLLAVWYLPFGLL